MPAGGKNNRQRLGGAGVGCVAFAGHRPKPRQASQSRSATQNETQADPSSMPPTTSVT